MSSPTTIDPSPVVIPGAQPLFLPGDSRRPAVLLLHGFTGYPGDVRYLAGRLNEAGYAVSVPRLPGHGTNNRDFRSSDWRDWQRRAIDSYLELAGRHNRVAVGGLSMGGLLASLLAAEYPVTQLLLFAPAFRTVNPLVPLTPILGWVVPPFANKEPEQYDDRERQYMADEYWNWNWPRQTASLYRLIRRARRRLSSITAPTYLVVSEKDETVPPSVSDLVQSSVSGEPATVLRLQNSGHVVTNGVDRDAVADGSLAWLDSHGGAPVN